MIGRHVPASLEALSDDELMELVQEETVRPGESSRARTALECLFARHHGRVYTWCAQLLGETEAFDAVQDIFFELLQRPERYVIQRSFVSWLYVVSRNHCLNVLRKLAKERSMEDVDDLDQGLLDAADPLVLHAEGEVAHLVRSLCRERLTVMEQKVIHLRYGWGMRVKDIDAALGLDNASGARTHLSTARRKLRAALIETLGEDGVLDLLKGGAA